MFPGVGVRVFLDFAYTRFSGLRGRTKRPSKSSFRHPVKPPRRRQRNHEIRRRKKRKKNVDLRVRTSYDLYHLCHGV